MSAEKKMADFEDRLREALGRKEPPAGFADRVMGRIREEARAKAPVPIESRRPSWRRRWIPAAIAATLLLSMGGWRYREYREGQRAKEQLLLALEITNDKLSFASKKVDELSQRTIQ